MKNILTFIFISLFFLSYSQSSLNLSEGRKELSLRRTAELNIILDSNKKGNLYLDFNKMVLAYSDPYDDACYTNMDLSKQLNIEIDYTLYGEETKSTKSYFIRFHDVNNKFIFNNCTPRANNMLTISIKGFETAKLFEKCFQDMLNILFKEDYNISNSNYFLEKEKVEKRIVRLKKEIAAKDKETAKIISVTNDNREDVALEQIKRINKVLINSKYYFKLNYKKRKLSLFESGEKKPYKKVILEPHFKTSITKESAHYVEFAYFSIAFWHENHRALELQARLDELMQILYGVDKNKPVSFESLSNHPQLKYLGKTIDDPEVQKLLANKNIYLVGDYINSSYIGVNYCFNKSSKLITRIEFDNVNERNVTKYNGLNSLPKTVNDVKIEPTSGGVYYILEESRLAKLQNESYKKYLDLELEKRKNKSEDYLINTREDLNRYYDPKGEDIFTLLDKTDILLEKYLTYKSGGKFKENEYCEALYLKYSKKIRLINCSSDKTYAIETGNFNDKELIKRFPYSVDLDKGLDIVLTQLAKIEGYKESFKAVVSEKSKYGENRNVEIILVKIETKGINRNIILKRYEKDSKNTFHYISIAQKDPSKWSSKFKPYKILTNNDIAVLEAKQQDKIKKLDALKKEGIYYPVDGSESKTVGVPIMTFKIRKDKTVEVVEISTNTIDDKASPLLYWKSKVLKSINGVSMVNMDGEKLKRACQGKIGVPIEIINKEGLIYRPKREYWLYGDLKTIDFDILFPNREQGISEGSFTFNGSTYTGEYINIGGNNGGSTRKSPRGKGEWKGKKATFKGTWVGEPEGLFTVTVNSNKDKYAIGTFKQGVPIGKWKIHDLENTYNSDFEIVFDGNGKVIKTPDMAEVSTKLEKSSENKRTVIYFNLRQYENYSAFKLVYSIGYLTGDCKCKNESTAATLDYTEYYIDKSGKKVFSYFPSTICTEFKDGHITNISEDELNKAIDRKIHKLWEQKSKSNNSLSDVYTYSEFIGRKSSSFNKVYAPSVTQDCTTEKEVKVVNWKDYDIWFLWK